MNLTGYSWSNKEFCQENLNKNNYDGILWQISWKQNLK